MKCWHLRYRKSDVEVNHSSSSTSSNSVEENDISADNNANERQSRDSSISKEKSRMTNKMLYILRELICCLIAAIITTYAAYHSGYSKISTPPTAMPFFPDGSLVKDWFRGELRHAVTQSLDHDISFIMYYAPWDAESQNARKEFDLAANFYDKQVFFAAVNCWQPNGECNSERNRHGVRVWPGLVAHRGQRVVIYRGPNTAPYYIKFIRNLMNPLERVISRSDLIKLVQKHDAVIYATVSNWTDYVVFYKTALKLLEIDPMREVSVAVSTSSLLDNQTQTPFIQLITANGTVISTSQNWTVSYLLNWALKYIHRPIGWISPTGLGKSHAVASFLKSNPTLFLFSPRNPFQDYDYYYQIIRWIALQYYNCQEHRNDKYFMDAVFSGLKKYEDRMNRQYKQCLQSEKFADREFDKELLCDNIYTSTTMAPNFNKCLDNNFINKPSIHGYCSISKHESNNSNFEQEHISLYPRVTESDIFSSNNLLTMEQKQKCRFFFASRKFLSDLQMKDITHVPIFKSKELKGLACKTNVTLALTVIDSLKYTSLANALGVDILSVPEKTKVIIVDADRESHYLMNASYTYENLIEFITKFTMRNLTRNVLSRVRSSEHPSDYTVKNHSSCTPVDDNSICIQELTTNTFLSTIMTPKQAFVVLYYSSACGMCTEASRIFLRLARMFRPLKFLNFVRIDSDIHSVPWEYDMPQYPTILFIPSQSKADSRVFPYELLPTTSNVIIFILTNLESSMRLQALWILCNKAKIPSELESCTAYLRLEVAKTMKNYLKRWRRIRHLQTKQTKDVLKGLKHLRLLHGLLGNVGTNKYRFINNIIDQFLSSQKMDEQKSR